MAHVFLELRSLLLNERIPEALHGLSVQRLIDQLVGTYARRALASTINEAQEVFDNLLHVKAYVPICEFFQWSIFTQSRNAATIIEALCPSIRSHIDRYGVNVLGPLCQQIFIHWINVVLGPTPDPTFADIITPLARWTCTCDGCRQVKKFLKQSATRTITFERIGAPTRRHIEIETWRYMMLAARCQTIKTSPQGLIVSLDPPLKICSHFLNILLGYAN